jgi:hypothetical protein
MRNNLKTGGTVIIGGEKSQVRNSLTRKGNSFRRASKIIIIR